MYKKIRVPDGLFDEKYLEQLYIEIPSEEDTQLNKVPNINDIYYGTFNSKYAVYWKDLDHTFIIRECETSDEAMVFYSRTINAIISAYNTRKDSDYSSNGEIRLKDIEKTLFTDPPGISI